MEVGAILGTPTGAPRLCQGAALKLLRKAPKLLLMRELMALPLQNYGTYNRVGETNFVAAPGEISGLLTELRLGNREALTRLIPLVYRELHRLAEHYLRAERVDHTLQPTALVHEAYLRLAGQDQADWRDRGQFIGVAAQLMRRVLVDHARARCTRKRDRNRLNRDVDVAQCGAAGVQLEEILAVDEALGRLAGLDPQQCRIVEMRYFAGLTVEETAGALGISPRTVKRNWAMASAWLRTQLSQPV
jgi:RNA polymerase sigma-70 factor, ECF subfamily